MASKFTFPPPPPPPPKAAAPEGYGQQSNSNSFSGQGRGGRGGRGVRGDFRGRGRGIFRGRGSGGHRVGFEGRQGQQTGGASFQHQYQTGQTFSNGLLNSAQQPNGYATNLISGPGNHNAQGCSTNQLTNGTGATFNHPYDFNILKRKRDYAQNAVHSWPKNVAKVEVAPAVPSFGAPLPLPQKPSTFPLSSPSNEEPASTMISSRKRKSNQLGLTPKGEEREESEEEVDEEAVATASLSNAALQIEYRGMTTSLGSAADLAAWVEERKKRFPTKARVEEKKREATNRAQERAEAQKKLIEARKKEKEQKQKESDTKLKAEKSKLTSARQEMKDEKAKMALEKHVAKAEKLRKKIQKIEERASRAARIVTNRQDGHAGAATSMSDIDVIAQIIKQDSAEAGTNAGLDDELKQQDDIPIRVGIEEIDSVNSSDSDSMSSSSYDSPSSDSSTEAESDADEESSTILPATTATTATNQSMPKPPRATCNNFARYGRCKFGRKCHFEHVRPGQNADQGKRMPRPEATARNTTRRDRAGFEEIRDKKRTSLFQRLVAQEKMEENKLVLDAIKYLGERGVLTDHGAQTGGGG